MVVVVVVVVVVVWGGGGVSLPPPPANYQASSYNFIITSPTLAGECPYSEGKYSVGTIGYHKAVKLPAR